VKELVHATATASEQRTAEKPFLRRVVMAKNPVVFIVKAEMSSLTFSKLAEKEGVRNSRWTAIIHPAAR